LGFRIFFLLVAHVTGGRFSSPCPPLMFAFWPAPFFFAPRRGLRTFAAPFPVNCFAPRANVFGLGHAGTALLWQGFFSSPSFLRHVKDPMNDINKGFNLPFDISPPLSPWFFHGFLFLEVFFSRLVISMNGAGVAPLRYRGAFSLRAVPFPVISP